MVVVVMVILTDVTYQFLNGPDDPSGMKLLLVCLGASTKNGIG